MCVLSIKVPIRKKSGNLFNDPRIYIYKQDLALNNQQELICHKPNQPTIQTHVVEKMYFGLIFPLAN